MTRRKFLQAAGCLAVSWPLDTRAQQANPLARVVYLDSPRRNPWVAGLLSGLKELGYLDGKNIRLIRIETAASTVAEMKIAISEVLPEADVLVVGGTIGGAGAKSAHASIPVVFISVGAPVDIGLVESLAHPGGNMTGVTFEAASETYPKRLQILKELLPNVSRVAVLGGIDDPNFAFAMTSLTRSAPNMRVTLTALELSSTDDLQIAFENMKRDQVEAVLVVAGSVTYGRSQAIASLALANGLPSCHGFRERVAAGGLVSLGPDLVSLAKQSAHLIDKILKGEKPANIPVEQPERYVLSINLNTARALGLTVPPALLARADEVIE